MSGRPYLSIVTTTRNDNHSDNQLFVDGLLAQIEKFCIPAEIVLVEWNPLPGGKSLAASLRVPARSTYATVRVITVPRSVHMRYRYSSMPFYQMIAKNVGVRRSRGRFVLVTNADLLFPDALFSFIASERMREGVLYRTDRYDVSRDMPSGASLAQRLAFCRSHILRINARDRTRDLTAGKLHSIYNPLTKSERPRLHTNACGDFQLLDRKHWFSLRGYPEFDIQSLHIDSLFEYMAVYSGIKEEILEYPCCVYHIEHTAGWKPKLDRDFRHKFGRVRIMNFEEFLILEKFMFESKAALRVNKGNWGLGDRAFRDTRVCVPTGGRPCN